jgi:hypothetical protein
MLKRVAVLALMLWGSMAFVGPQKASAQDYYYGGRNDSRYYRNDNRWRNERRENRWREHEWRERERRERAWRQQQWKRNRYHDRYYNGYRY